MVQLQLSKLGVIQFIRAPVKKKKSRQSLKETL